LLGCRSPSEVELVCSILNLQPAHCAKSHLSTGGQALALQDGSQPVTVSPTGDKQAWQSTQLILYVCLQLSPSLSARRIKGAKVSSCQADDTQHLSPLLRKKGGHGKTGYIPQPTTKPGVDTSDKSYSPAILQSKYQTRDSGRKGKSSLNTSQRRHWIPGAGQGAD
jgi:hypothetical protein